MSAPRLGDPSEYLGMTWLVCDVRHVFRPTRALPHHRAIGTCRAIVSHPLEHRTRSTCCPSPAARSAVDPREALRPLAAPPAARHVLCPTRAGSDGARPA